MHYGEVSSLDHGGRPSIFEQQTVWMFEAWHRMTHRFSQRLWVRCSSNVSPWVEQGLQVVAISPERCWNSESATSPHVSGAQLSDVPWWWKESHMRCYMVLHGVTWCYMVLHGVTVIIHLLFWEGIASQPCFMPLPFSTLCTWSWLHPSHDAVSLCVVHFHHFHHPASSLFEDTSWYRAQYNLSEMVENVPSSGFSKVAKVGAPGFQTVTKIRLGLLWTWLRAQLQELATLWQRTRRKKEHVIFKKPNKVNKLPAIPGICLS